MKFKQIKMKNKIKTQKVDLIQKIVKILMKKKILKIKFKTNKMTNLINKLKFKKNRKMQLKENQP